MMGFKTLGWAAAIAVLALGFAPAMAAPSNTPATSGASLGTGVLPGFAQALAATDHPMSDKDKQYFSAAFDAIDSGSWPRALAQAALIKNPLAAKIITWAYLCADDTKPGFDELVKFANDNPDWPLQETLLAKAEKALPETMPPARLIAWFAGQEPLTGEGMIRLGQALLTTGQTAYGAGWISRAWSTQVFDASKQRDLFAAYGQYLKGQPSVARMDMLLWAREAAQAEWLLPQVPADQQRIAQARIALMEYASNAKGIVSSLPAKAQKDPGVLFDLVRYMRRRGDDDDARRKLLSIEHPETLPHPEKWWIERHAAARNAIEEKEYRDAYTLVSHTGLTAGNEFADAEWLAGWLALRFLDKPKDAYKHFATLEKGVTYPISLARAEYWVGRAAQAMGDKPDAIAAYTRAAQFPNTYYGQLSAESSLLSNQALALPATPGVEKAKWDAFFDDELVKAMQLIKQVDEDRYMRTLSYEIAEKAEDNATLILLSEFLCTLDQPAISIRIAKKASQKHMLLTDYLYPVFTVPAFPGTGAPPEPALILGLARQESEFNPRAVSAAGARGLMQILPSTAQLTARKHGIAYYQDRLLTDPAYNMQLGMAHIADLLERFDGSYILVIASYNAGASRIDEWLTTYGDPRKKGVDPIDWIEMIPFTETRNYVQRVFENAMVYRHRIAGAPVAYTLNADLHRTSATPLDLSYTTKGKAKKTPPAPPIQAVEPAAGQKTDSAVKPEPAPVDDGPGADTGPIKTVPGAAVPPKPKELDEAPGSAGDLPTGSIGVDEDAPPAPVPPNCKTFIVRPNGAADCIDN